MAKTYKILVNDGKGTDIKPVQVVQGVGDKGSPVRLLAKRGWRFELQDELKGNGAAPDQVRVKRVGKNLTLLLDGSQGADVVIEDFYADKTDSDKDNGMPTLVGQAENGGLYEFVPQDPAISSMPAQLKDGNTPVILALGGGPLSTDFALAALPLVAAAAGGIGGWAIAGGALAAVAVGGAGGGGGNGATAVKPSGQIGGLTHNALNDTGVSRDDNVTANTTPELTIHAEHGAKVVVTVGGKEYLATETATPGVYTVKVAEPLKDGVHTPAITVTNAAGSSTVNGDAFTLDTSATKNQDPSHQPTEVDDPNSAIVLMIGSIDDHDTSKTLSDGSKDTGSSNNDFITRDNTLSFSGTVTNFIANGDLVHVQLLKADGKTVLDTYLTPDSTGKWTLNNQANTLADGQYTIQAALIDKAGNAVTSPAVQVLRIASTAPFLQLLADTAEVTEGSTLTNKNVLSNDGDALASALGVVKVQKGDAITQAASSVAGATGTKLQGDFGELELFADGHYTYTPNDSLKGGVHGVDTFTYEVQTSGASARTARTTLKIDVTGVEDAATIDIVVGNLRRVTVGSNGDASDLTSFIEIQDQDAGDSVLKGLSTTAGANPAVLGGYGELVITTSTSAGKYAWDYTKTGQHKAGVIQHDLFTVESLDGSAKTTLDFQLDQAANTVVTTHEAHGQTSTVDTLTFKDINQQLIFDFTQPSTLDLNAKGLIASSVERIDITGGLLNGAATPHNTIKLNLSSLLQTDTFDGSNHRLYIMGDAGDTVLFSNDSTSAAIQHDANMRTVDGSSYWVYHIHNDELLVQTTIANITVMG